MKISNALISQHFTPKLIIKFLELSDRLPDTFRYQDLRIEFWHNCIWTNFGMISYSDYANYIYHFTECKSLQLPIKKINDRLFLVKGKVKPWYAVHDGNCECQLFRLRKNRSPELPQFFKYFNRPFCHHSLSVISF